MVRKRRYSSDSSSHSTYKSDDSYSDSNSGSKVKHASKLSKHCLLSDKKHRHQNYHHSSNHDRHHYREQDQKKKGSEQSASSTRHNKHRPKLDSDDTTKQSTKSSQRFDKSDSNRNNNGKSSHYSQRCYRKSYYDEVTNSSTESSDSNDDNVNVVMKTSDRKCVNNSVGIVSSSGSRNLKTTETKQHNDVRRSKHNDHKVVTQQQQLDKSVTTDIISDNATSTDIAMSSSYNTKSQFSSNKSNHHKSHTSVKTSSSKNVGSHSNSSKSSSSAHTLLNRSSKVTLSKQHLIGSGISDDHDNEDSKLDIAEASEKIEQAMLKRRQRIEEWRQKRKPKSVKDPLDDVPKKDETIDTDKWILDEENEETSEEGKANKLDDDNSNCNNDKTGIDTAEDKELKKDDVEQTRSKENNLSSDEFKDNDNVVEEGNVGDEEIDPLDEYMLMISKQIKNLNEGEMTIRNSQGVSNIVASNNQSPQSPQQRSQKPTTANDSKIDSCGGVTKAVIVRTNVSERKQINKGDIMEQNADALEYSSEDYSDDEDIFACKKSKADCINTDHNMIYYRKFRKRFYNEVPEIANLSKEEVAQLRQDMDNIQVTGKKCPKPIKTWAQCITYLSILDLLKRYGMHKPTPIQSQALPVIASGRDMLGIAKTGSGKTLAFLLPMFRHIKAQPPLEPDDGPIGIIITPTRELAMQIAKECRRFCKGLDLRVVAVYGGTGISEQIADLKRGTEIVVCTPGRMIDMLAANNGKVTNLRRATYVVIDEADRMFDMGFEPQVNKILECIRPDRQTVMFSATFPRQMEALARRALRKPIEIVVGGRSVVCESVDQQVFMLNDDQKYLKLLELLGIYHEHGSVLVFVHKQEHADELMKNLMHSSYPCLALHGGIDQYDRDSVISDFKAGVVRLMIATSVAARGIDVKDIILVVNYDCPNHYEDYVHRCGRTGRAGRDGVAVTFITASQEKLAGDVIKALELCHIKAGVELQQLWDNYKAKMAQQGIQIKSGVGGFGGKGFKFDDEEQAFLDDRKRVQKLMFGMQDSDDEDGVDIDNEIDKTLKSKTRIKNPGEVLSSAAGSMADSSTLQSDDNRQTNVEKLAFAKLLAAKIHHNKADIKDILTQSSSSKLDNTMLSNFISGKSIAEQIAGKLNNKLNYVPKEREGGQDQEDIKVYEEELEINDFPQNARWKVTSKETLSHIAEYAEAAITVRGKYFPPGKPPPQGESRLYLILEALTERGLQLAKSEIKRIIKEEMMKMQNPALQMVNRGRYKVM